MGRSVKFFCILFVFFIAGALAANYTLNHFYVNGAYFADSGWFAYLSAHTTQWPASNPPALGGTFFSIHFSPGFYISSAVYGAIQALGLALPDVVWFSMLQGFWLSLTAVALFSLLIGKEEVRPIHISAMALASLLLSFNGIFLATIGFPHFEIAIPALLAAFFALFSRGRRGAALVALGWGLLMREDAGLHYFGLFFLMACYCWAMNGWKFSPRVKLYGGLALACFVYSAAAIAFQKSNYSAGGNALASVYLGVPTYAHVTADFLRDRLWFLATERLYIWVPLLITIFLAFWKREWWLLIGVGAVVPWIVFSLLALTPQAGTLTSYYAFPVAIALLWPVMGRVLFAAKDGAPRVATRDILVVGLASLLLYGGSEGNHDPEPWKRFGPDWVGKVNATDTGLKDFLRANPQLKLVYDDAVTSLLNQTSTKAHWRYTMSFAADEIQAFDGILYHQGGWLTPRVMEIAAEGQFNSWCYLPETPFVVVTRTSDAKSCVYR